MDAFRSMRSSSSRLSLRSASTSSSRAPVRSALSSFWSSAGPCFATLIGHPPLVLPPSPAVWLHRIYTGDKVSSHPQSILCDRYPQTIAAHRLAWRVERCIIMLGMLYSGVQEKEDCSEAYGRSAHRHRHLPVYRHRGFYEAVGEEPQRHAGCPDPSRRPALGGHRGARWFRLQDGRRRLLRGLPHGPRCSRVGACGPKDPVLGAVGG